MTAYHNWTHRSRSRGGTDPLEFGGHGPWIEPELVNGYVDTTVAPDTFAYRHAPGSPDDAWEIEFRGHVEGPSGTYAFVMPSEDLPLSDKYGITEGEDSDTGDGLVVEWLIEAATGFVFFTYPVGGASTAVAAVEVIHDSTLGAAGFFTVTSIPATFKHLELFLNSRSAGATDADSILIQLNGDTSTSNYIDTLIQTNAAGALSGGGPETANGRWSVGICPGSTSLANAFGACRIIIVDYANTTTFKTGQWESSSMGDSGSYWVRNGGGMYLSTSAVSSIKVYSLNGASGNFAANTRLTVWGRS